MPYRSSAWPASPAARRATASATPAKSGNKRRPRLRSACRSPDVCSLCGSQSGRDFDPDLAIITQRTGVKRQELVAFHIFNDAFPCRGMCRDHVIVTGVERLDDAVNQIVRKVLAGHAEIIEADRLVVRLQ